MSKISRRSFMKTSASVLLLGTASSVFTGCSGTSNTNNYLQDDGNGYLADQNYNYVTLEKYNQIQVGMTRTEVEEIFGEELSFTSFGTSGGSFPPYYFIGTWYGDSYARTYAQIIFKGTESNKLLAWGRCVVYSKKQYGLK